MGGVRDTQLAIVGGGDLARCPRPTHDQQLVDARFVAEVQPALPARQARGLRAGPSDQLLEPPDLGLDLGRDRQGVPRLVEHSVDPASIRAVHSNLGERPPPRVEHAEQRFKHRGLMPVADERSGIRVQACREVRTERDRNPGVGR